MKDRLISRYFVKPARVLDDEIDPALHKTTNLLMHRVGTIARKFQINMDQRQLPWPLPVDEKPKTKIVPASPIGSYDYLDEPQYDADIGICVLRSLQDIDPAVAHLALRDRQFLHLCLLTYEELPSYSTEKDRDTHRGVMALPVQSLSEFEVFRNQEGSEFRTNRLQAGRMTIECIQELTDAKLMELIFGACGKRLPSK